MRARKPIVLIAAVMVLVSVGCASGAEDRADLPVGQISSPTSAPASTSTSVVTPSSTNPEVRPEQTEEDDQTGQTEQTEAVEDGPAVVLRRDGIDAAYVELLEAVDGVQWVALLDSGQVHLAASADRSGRIVDEFAPGFVVQLEAIVHRDIERTGTYSPDLADALAVIDDNEVLLSESSAELRRLAAGSTMTFDNGAEFEVADVLSDDIVGTAEVVFSSVDALVDAGAGSGARQVAFVEYVGTGLELEEALLALEGGSGIRVFGGRGGGGRDRIRTTLPTIEVKKIFGEFSFRPRGGGAIEIEQAWVDENLVLADLPLLGEARCHRLFAEILTDVLQSLIDDGLEEVIDPTAFQGCWNPRRIGGADRLSKHSWGIAADINFGNPLDGGPGSPVNPELLQRMLASDVISGHLWTATPDPGHFEYRGP